MMAFARHQPRCGEDETGIANAIISPDVFAESRVTIVSYPFLLIEGRLQHQDNVFSVKVDSVEAAFESRSRGHLARFSLRITPASPIPCAG